MTQLMWEPARVAGLTPSQIACLCSDRPPGAPGGRAKTWEEMAAALARQEADRRAWEGDDGLETG